MSTYTFDSGDAFDALAYPAQHQGTVAYLQGQVSQFSSTLMDAGREFMQRSRDAFEHYNGTAAIRFIREVVQSVQGTSPTPYIGMLLELKQMQDASLLMQRWIMANPVARHQYHKQQLDGYSDTYVDVSPKDVGDDHYDYRRVMDGALVFDDKGDWQCKQYLDQLHEGDRDLLHEEQMDIRQTWTAMDLILQLGKDDPTSASGGSL
jgi:hypothetical protein